MWRMARYADGTHQRPIRCKRCGKPATKQRTISRRGNCLPCGKKELRAIIKEMHAKRGPRFERAMQGAIAGAQRALREQ